MASRAEIERLKAARSLSGGVSQSRAATQALSTTERYARRQIPLPVFTPQPERGVFEPLLPGVGIGAGAGFIGGAGQMTPEPPVVQVAGAIPAVAAGLGLTLPPALVTGLAVAGAGYGLFQALGGGEGGGLFGLNILGGDDFSLAGTEFGGPGLSEPMVPYTEWHSGNKQFYYVSNADAGKTGKGGRVFMYNTDTGRWKHWPLRPPSVAMIGKNMPSHKQITRLRRNLRKHSADARTILKITSPTSLKGYSYRGKGRR